MCPRGPGSGPRGHSGHDEDINALQAPGRPNRGQQEKPTHLNQAVEAAATRGGLFPCSPAAGNKSRAVLAAQSRGIEDAGRSDTLETAIFVQNWANHLGPHPAISHISSYVGKILQASRCIHLRQFCHSIAIIVISLSDIKGYHNTSHAPIKGGTKCRNSSWLQS